MLLRQIQYFLAVVNEKSFTQAAFKLNISQSAISQQIANLEQELETALMLRHNRSFSLTPAGEYFFANSRSIVADLEKLKKKTIEIGLEEPNEARLRVGYLSNYSGTELNLAIAQFSHDYPDVPIEITQGTHEELYLGLLDKSFDIVLNDQRRAFSDDLKNLILIECDCYIETSTIHELAQYDEIEIDKLKRHACILISSKEQQDNEAAFYKDTLGFDCPFLYASNLEQARMMVIAKRGFLPIQSVTLPNSEQNVKRIKILRRGKVLQCNYCVFYLKEHENYYISEFAKLVAQSFNNSIMSFLD